ncbi:MAG: iron-containing redox enzyme family protein [Cellvibrionaceae bacterium]
MMVTFTQKELYLYNKERIQDTVHHNLRVLNFENQWIKQWFSDFEQDIEFQDYRHFIKHFDQFIADESKLASPTGDYVSDEMTKEEFRRMIQEFAVDGLTEAQVFYYVIPRLHLKAQMPMLRIMIDEFGSANPQRMHTALFMNLLRELNLPVEESYYINRVSDTSYEFVNMYFWLTLRANDPSFFVGALTYLETIIPVVFPSLVNACKRLNIEAHAYYSEHCHIDEFHALEGKKILKAMWETNTLDLQKAWLGVQLSSAVTNKVFDHAVEVARREGATAYSVVTEGDVSSQKDRGQAIADSEVIA